MTGKREKKNRGKAEAKRGKQVSRLKVDSAAGSGKRPTPKSKGLRRHLRQLESLLAQAAKKEAARVRKLEKAHLRRQRIEAEIDGLRAASFPAKAVLAAPVLRAPAPAPVEAAPSGPARRRGRATPTTPKAPAGAPATRRTRAPRPTAAGASAAKPASRRSGRIAAGSAATPPAPSSAPQS